MSNSAEHIHMKMIYKEIKDLFYTQMELNIVS